MLRMLVGVQLRRLREFRGLSREQAGYEIRASESKISRMELGRVSFRTRDVADLLTLYGIAPDDPERDRLMALVRQANTPGWWHQYGDVLAQWFQPYVGLETAASLIRTYEVQVVPGLLQTADYARAVFHLGHQVTGPDIERRVDLRMARQRLLRGDSSPTLWAVIDEAALRRPIGGTRVLRAQLEALVEATRRPNIRIQILPFQAGGHAAMGGAFTILRFPEEDLTDMVYIELLTSALYLDRQPDIDAYGEAMEHLCINARQPDQSVDVIEAILKDLP
jgi:hypothetical protein